MGNKIDIGRIVRVRIERGGSGGLIVTRPAIVTQVFAPETVNLTVFTEEGDTDGRAMVRMHSVTHGLGLGQWHWFDEEPQAAPESEAAAPGG